MRFGVIGLLLIASVSADAQTSCDGKTVSAVVIRRSERTVMDKAHAPGWSRAILQPLLLGEPTHENAIRPFLQLAEGEECSELRRAESERLLRLQPYLANATVSAVDEPDGRVRIEVETVDDLRPIVGLGLHGSVPSNVELGNSNIAGSGQLAAADWRDGRAFRDGFGMRYTDYHFLDRPVRASLDLDREPLGSLVQASLTRPFFTDLQRSGAFAGYLRDDGYAGFVRPQGDPLSLSTVRERADVGAAFRLGPGGGTTRVLLGGLASVERRRTVTQPVIISDSGFVATNDSTLVNRFGTSDATQLGIVAGVRAISFVKATSFDALEGVQDIARGLQVATTVGSLVGGSTGSFFNSDAYMGIGGAESFVGLRTQIESRHTDGAWNNTVASGRLAWYSRPSERVTQIWSVNYAGAWREDVPFQLTVNDPVAGIRGYADSRVAGGRLLTLRGERRIILPGISSYLGWGLASFVDAAHMWKGDVPFGTTATRASFGIGALGAVPRQSRTLARFDLAYPIVPDHDAKRLVARFTISVTGGGRSFSGESSQIARARRGTSATDIFDWP